MDESGRLKIGITGASGFLGSYLAETIVRAGHLAVGFSRHPEHKPVPGCGEMREFAPGRIDLDELDAVVHLAGASIFGPWTRRRKELIRTSRVEGTRAVADALLRHPQETRPRVLVSASAIGYYGEGGERELDETAPPGSGFLAEVAQAWEAEAFRAREAGVRVVALRFGIILGREGGALKMMRPLFLAGLGARLGDGRQWMSWVHVKDAANLALFCIEHGEAQGPVNAVSPQPLRNAEFTQALARRWRRKARLAIPAPVLKAVLGEASGVLLASQRVIPAKARELGFEFQFAKI